MGLVEDANTWCPEAWEWPPSEQLRAFLEEQIRTIATNQCHRRRLPHDLIDDVRQETYIALFLQEGETPKSFAEFAAACRRIAENAARRFLRPILKTATPLPDEVTNPTGSEPAIEEFLLAAIPDELTRTIFKASFVDGLSWAEIGRKLGLKKYNVNALRDKAMNLIRMKFPHLAETRDHL